MGRKTALTNETINEIQLLPKLNNAPSLARKYHIGTDRLKRIWEDGAKLRKETGVGVNAKSEDYTTHSETSDDIYQSPPPDNLKMSTTDEYREGGAYRETSNFIAREPEEVLDVECESESVSDEAHVQFEEDSETEEVMLTDSESSEYSNFIDVDQLVDELELMIDARRAGNTNRKLLLEAQQILDVLADLIPARQHKALTRELTQAVKKEKKIKRVAKVNPAKKRGSAVKAKSLTRSQAGIARMNPVALSRSDVSDCERNCAEPEPEPEYRPMPKSRGVLRW